MNANTAARLIEINRDFYTRFGDSFSATRQRIQPGVRRLLETLNGDESILDLGCGNAELARVVGSRSHRGSYLGVDFSAALLRDAGSQPQHFPAKFIQADLTKLSTISDQRLTIGNWSVVTAFAVFHHIPSGEIRLDMLRTVHDLLADDGRFILSTWQFLNSEKLRVRIQDWSRVGLLSSDVDPGDYLLDWRSGGEGLRYVHHFREDELQELAQSSGFEVKDVFYSDGETGNLSLYQVWKKNFTR